MLFYQKEWRRKKSFTWDKVHAILYFRHARKAISESANLKQAAVYRYPLPLTKAQHFVTAQHTASKTNRHETMHIYATLKSDEQHVVWEDGKNGNERPMFCEVSDGNGERWAIQLPNTTFLKTFYRSFSGKLVWVPSEVTGVFGIFSFCLLSQGCPKYYNNSSSSCISLPRANMTGMHYHAS